MWRGANDGSLSGLAPFGSTCVFFVFFSKVHLEPFLRVWIENWHALAEFIPSMVKLRAA